MHAIAWTGAGALSHDNLGRNVHEPSSRTGRETSEHGAFGALTQTRTARTGRSNTRRPGEEFGERVSMNRQCFHRTDGDGGC